MTGKFKCTLYGFRREDVLAYINELSTNYATTLTEKEERINELLQENAELRQKLKIQGDLHADK